MSALNVAVRAWAVPDYLRLEGSQPRQRYTDIGPSEWSLTFDTETQVDLAQKLRIVTWQVRKKGRLRRSGIAYEPKNLSADEVVTLADYCRERGLRLLTREQFVEWVFYDVAWKKRGLVVGSVNLVFDLTRLAMDHYPARPKHKRRSMRGGFTLVLSRRPSHPNIQIKKINGRAAFIRFVTSAGRHAEARNRERGGDSPNHEGYFVDIGVLGAALLGRRLSLRTLAETLETANRKLTTDGHGQTIDDGYLD